MMQIIPKYIVRWELDRDKSNESFMIISASNIKEATDWFNKINFDITRVTKLTVILYEHDVKQNQ